MIYLVKFQTYFKCTEPHKSKYAKLLGPLKIFKKNRKKIFFFIIFDALPDKNA